MLVLVLSLLPSLMFSGDVFFTLCGSVFQNLTYFERENQFHNYYLQNKERKLYNPFSRGCCTNLLEFLIPSLPCLIRGRPHTSKQLNKKKELD